MLPLKNIELYYMYLHIIYIVCMFSKNRGTAARYITTIYLGHVTQAAVQHRAHTQSLQCCTLEPVNLIARSS